MITYNFDIYDTDNNDLKENVFIMKRKACCNHTKEVEKAYIGIMIENDEKRQKFIIENNIYTN